jgi:hypothetical protein
MAEDEAIQIIREEMAKAGVNLSQRGVELKEVSLAEPLIVTNEEFAEEIDKQFGRTTDPTPVRRREPPSSLRLDLGDPNLNVAVEFISRDDYDALTASVMMSTVQEYEFKSLAKVVAGKIAASSRGLYVGVLYEPATR